MASAVMANTPAHPSATHCRLKLCEIFISTGKLALKEVEPVNGIGVVHNELLPRRGRLGILNATSIGWWRPDRVRIGPRRPSVRRNRAILAHGVNLTYADDGELDREKPQPWLGASLPGASSHDDLAWEQGDDELHCQWQGRTQRVQRQYQP